MIFLELFSGSKIMSQTFAKNNWKTFNIDWKEDATLNIDILNLTTADIIKLCGLTPDVIWASPECTCFSLAARDHHIKKINNEWIFKTQKAIHDINTIKNVLKLIKELNPKIWFIENPMAKLRFMPFMPKQYEKKLDQCMYGLDVKKPTNIWTNMNIQFKLCSKNHIHKTWDEYKSKKNHLQRAILPKQFCEFIFWKTNNQIQQKQIKQKCKENKLCPLITEN